MQFCTASLIYLPGVFHWTQNELFVCGLFHSWLLVISCHLLERAKYNIMLSSPTSTYKSYMQVKVNITEYWKPYCRKASVQTAKTQHNNAFQYFLLIEVTKQLGRLILICRKNEDFVQRLVRNNLGVIWIWKESFVSISIV